MDSLIDWAWYEHSISIDVNDIWQLAGRRLSEYEMLGYLLEYCFIYKKCIDLNYSRAKDMYRKLRREND